MMQGVLPMQHIFKVKIKHITRKNPKKFMSDLAAT